MIKWNNNFWEEIIAYFPRHDTVYIEKDGPNSYSIIACVFFAGVSFIPSSCLAAIGYTHNRHKDWWDEFIKDAVEMGSVATVYISSPIKFGLGIQKLIQGINRQHRDRIILV
jgi:hypothetical protein